MTRLVDEAGGRIVEMPITFLEREAGQSKLSGGIFTEELSLVTRWGLAKRGGQALDLAQKGLDAAADAVARLRQG